jgi:hypothetical protein
MRRGTAKAEGSRKRWTIDYSGVAVARRKKQAFMEY